MTARIFNISLDIVPVPIYLTLSIKGYNKAMELYNGDNILSTPGRTNIISLDGVLKTIVTYIDLNTDKYSIVDIKGLLVHELNHIVTEVFNTYGFSCDETRSYMLQALYVKVVTIIDKELDNGKTR